MRRNIKFLANAIQFCVDTAFLGQLFGRPKHASKPQLERTNLAHHWNISSWNMHVSHSFISEVAPVKFNTAGKKSPYSYAYRIPRHRLILAVHVPLHFPLGPAMRSESASCSPRPRRDEVGGRAISIPSPLLCHQPLAEFASLPAFPRRESHND
jgi:hypothetical protein